MTPQQQRWMYPMTKQEPAAALVWTLAALALGPLFVLCDAIDAAHREQGRRMAQMGAWTLRAGS